MRTVSLSTTLSDAEVDRLAGTFLDESHFDLLIQEDADVFKPDGSVLLKLRKNVVPMELGAQAYVALKEVPMRFANTNRGLAAGRLDDMEELEGRKIVARSGTRARVLREDGTVSKTIYAKPARSGIAGFFDRNARFPFCRLTSFNLESPEKWAAALPYITAINDVFAREAPERYAAQLGAIERTHPDFYIHNTVFTTLTVNRNWQTAVHKDAGDYQPGFGVMSVLQAGEYDGGYLVFPKYRIAVDLRSCDVLLADVHEWHGNTKIIGTPGHYVRLSLVLYYRAKMIHCGSAADELERAKNRRQGDRING